MLRRWKKEKWSRPTDYSLYSYVLCYMVWSESPLPDFVGVWVSVRRSRGGKAFFELPFWTGCCLIHSSRYVELTLSNANVYTTMVYFVGAMRPLSETWSDEKNGQGYEKGTDGTEKRREKFSLATAKKCQLKTQFSRDHFFFFFLFELFVSVTLAFLWLHLFWRLKMYSYFHLKFSLSGLS